MVSIHNKGGNMHTKKKMKVYLVLRDVGEWPYMECSWHCKKINIGQFNIHNRSIKSVKEHCRKILRYLGYEPTFEEFEI